MPLVTGRLTSKSKVKHFSSARFLDIMAAKSFRCGGYWYVVLHLSNEIWIKIKRTRPGTCCSVCDVYWECSHHFSWHRVQWSEMLLLLNWASSSSSAQKATSPSVDREHFRDFCELCRFLFLPWWLLLHYIALVPALIQDLWPAHLYPAVKNPLDDFLGTVR